MHRLMLIDALHPEEMRMVITDQKSTIHEFDFTTAAKQQIKGNIYLAKVTRVEPSLQAAFVEYGGGKQGFLPFAEIHADYYQIPVADRARLLEEEAMAEEEGEEFEAGAQNRGDRQDRGERRDRDRRRRGRGRDRHRNRNDRPEGEAKAGDATDAEAQAGVVLDSENTEVTSEVRAEITESAEGYSLTLTEITLPQPDQEEAQPEAEESDKRMHESAGIELPESAKSEVTEEELQAITANDDDADVQGQPEINQERPERPEARENNSSGEVQEVETLSSEEEIERPRRNHFSRRYKIQEVIKRGQIMLVQVIKEERGNKGVSLTTYLSLAGRYCVLMPNSPRGGGVSRKIGTGEDRKRLKSIIDDLELPRGMSVIIRTAGANRTKVEVKRDFDYLVKLWNQIREDTLASSAPALIYQESDLIKRSIRDVYNNDIEEILVEGEAAYKDAKHFMKMLVPSHAPRVKLFKGNVPLFYHYNVEEQLLSMNEPVVKLRSGGYIVMNPTEALISIDVNSGRSTGERNIEETAVKTNVEAAQEIARQLRLRDLAGLIVIDFIDMMDGKNRRNVERVLKDALRSDRAKIQIGRISPFGLLEMSRQRLRPSIAESVSKACDHCNGTGVVRTDAAVAIQLIRSIEKEAGQQLNIERFKVFLTPSVAVYLLNHMRDTLHKLEQDYAVEVEVQIDPALHEGNFRMEKIRCKDKEKQRQKEQLQQRKPITMEATEEEMASADAMEAEMAADEGDDGAESETTSATESNERPQRRDRDRRRRGGRGRDRDNPRDRESPNKPADAELKSSEDTADSTAATPKEAAEPKERGGRGRDRNRSRNHRESNSEPHADAASVSTAAALTKARTETVTAIANSIEYKSATALSEKTPAIPVVTAASGKPKATPELAVLADPKPEKPARKGWWQKIME